MATHQAIFAEPLSHEEGGRTSHHVDGPLAVPQLRVIGNAEGF